MNEVIDSLRLRLVGRLDHVMRRVRLGAHFLSVFVPHNPRGDGDAVRALATGIISRVKSPPRCVLLEEAVDHVRRASAKARLPGPPSRVVLFAHPNATENGFSVNPSAAISDSSLYPSWWQATDHSYEFVYAHVCNGASVLDREIWAPIFPRWVSYRMDVEVFLATDRAHERWTELGSCLVMAAWESENVDALFRRVQATYSEAMARVHDTFDAAGGDDITMALIEKSLAALAKRSG